MLRSTFLFLSIVGCFRDRCSLSAAAIPEFGLGFSSPRLAFLRPHQDFGVKSDVLWASRETMHSMATAREEDTKALQGQHMMTIC